MAGFQLGITAGGMELLAKGITGKEIRFRSILMGDGSYSGSVSEAAGMVSEKAVLPVSGLVRKENQVTVKGVLRFGETAEGFTWREVGLTAIDPDDGEEVLYAYGFGGSDYISGAGEAALDERVIQLTVLVSSAEQVTAELDASAVFVDEERLEEALEQASAALTHEKSGTVHRLSGLGERKGLVSCCFKAAAKYVKGDTFTVENTAYSVKMQDGSEAEDDLFAAGAAVSAVIDTEGRSVNFKAAGKTGTGYSVQDGQRTVTEDDVEEGVYTRFTVTAAGSVIDMASAWICQKGSTAPRLRVALIIDGAVVEGGIGDYHTNTVSVSGNKISFSIADDEVLDYGDYTLYYCIVSH
ncbi:MAG: phage tail protein [Oscillospiraceae bacterium]|nr:phage tail protein [Oscillospiraceae bacterium]